MKKVIASVMFVFIATLAFSQEVIPGPSQIKPKKGAFQIDISTPLIYDENNPDLIRITSFLNTHLQNYYGFQLHEQKKAKVGIQLIINDTISLGNEGYILDIDKKGILIAASKPAGIFYGIQTVKQLLPIPYPENKSLTIPYVEIRDQPRFVWRGLHLDVSRHFFPVSFIKKYLDYMAMYKLNTFHWHLTDDQGWRLEINKHPELTEISSWRDETIVGSAKTSTTYDGIGYGGFYTQKQIREIVQYATDRYITIVPEIEMPGHTSAVLVAFPDLGCTGGPYNVLTTWGISKDVFCAGKEGTFEFLKDVLDEVCELFPSKYIHIGGDECPKDRWRECPACQKRLREEGLKDEHELQSYFIKRIEKYLNSKGRQIIGWDEILEGGLTPGASVMSWRGIKGGVEAAKQKHSVVMCPSSHLYFIYYQSKDVENEPFARGGFLPLEKVYSYEPIPEELTDEESRLILGAQGCVWTEYIGSDKKMEYMLFPRICALAEVVWSPKEQKDFRNFGKRMELEYQRMDLYKVNYKDYRK